MLDVILFSFWCNLPSVLHPSLCSCHLGVSLIVRSFGLLWILSVHSFDPKFVWKASKVSLGLFYHSGSLTYFACSFLTGTRAYCLETVTFLRHYISFLDLPLSLISAAMRGCRVLLSSPYEVLTTQVSADTLRLFCSLNPFNELSAVGLGFVHNLGSH